MSFAFDRISSADLNKIPDLIDGMQSDLKGSMGKKGISYFLTTVINRISDRDAYVSNYTASMDILNKRWVEWKDQHVTEQSKIYEYEIKLVKCDAYLNLMKDHLLKNDTSISASSSQTFPQALPEGGRFEECDPTPWQEVYQLSTNLASSSVPTPPLQLKMPKKSPLMKFAPKPCSPDLNAESFRVSLNGSFLPKPC